MSGVMARWASVQGMLPFWKLCYYASTDAALMLPAGAFHIALLLCLYV
jgi:hypothetical protein